MKRRLSAIGVMLNLMIAVGGCQSPSSVSMLMRTVQKAIDAENTCIHGDRQRLQSWYQERRESLAAAFEADLAACEELDHQWVLDHGAVYAAACEALVERKLAQEMALDQRVENMELAGRVQQRAVEVLERQDELIGSLPNVWQWMEGGSMVQSSREVTE